MSNPKKQLTGSFTVSVGIKKHTELYQYHLRNKDRYSSFSAFISEAAQCLMANPNWRVNKNDNDKLDKLINLIENLDVVKVGIVEDVKEDKVFDASKGFSE